MTTVQERVATTTRLGANAARLFLSENRELLASFNWPDVEKAMYAWLQLHARTEIEQGAPSVDLYLQLQRTAFATLLDKGAIAPVADITKLGQQNLDAMRTATGIGAASVPAPVVELTPAEKLEREVIEDFGGRLTGDQFKAKLNNNRAYRDCYRRLAETNRIAVGSAPKAAAPSTDRTLSTDELFVKIDPDRYIRHMSDGQITCTNSRSEALAFSAQEAAQLVTKLRRNRFPQATVSE